MQEQELDLGYIFSIIKKWGFLILLFVILGLSAAIFYNYESPIVYQSEASLYVEPPVSSNQVNYDGILSNQKMVKTYTQIIKSRKILSKVKDDLNLSYSIDDLSDMLLVDAVSDTEIINIKVNSEQKSEAAVIANTIASVFIAEIKDTMNITNIRVIDEAVPNKTPISPRVNFNCLVGSMIGLFVGFILVFIIESMNHKITTHEDVKRYLSLKTIGIIPDEALDDENIVGKKGSKVKYNNSILNRTNELKIINNPNGMIAESIRMIRTNLNFRDLKVVNVVSTLPSEGKTSFICDLALSFALLEKKVLVIDCDLRKPKVHKKFGLSRQNGLTDVILSHGEISYLDAIQTFKDKGKDVSIDVLSAGSRVANPSELLNKKSFAQLIEKLREKYDMIFIDCSPISSMTDGILVSKLSDGTVYVIESDRVDYPVIQTCIEDLKNNNVTILGTVLTKVNVKEQKKLYGYKYDYYYSNDDRK